MNWSRRRERRHAFPGADNATIPASRVSMGAAGCRVVAVRSRACADAFQCVGATWWTPPMKKKQPENKHRALAELGGMVDEEIAPISLQACNLAPETIESLRQLARLIGRQLARERLR
ncbi:MAG TPA: hypothetical protein DHW63_07060 [Hyphomonadaceae bacterium]|nr:hypothetical protein [Hyphomonadaceae bacterium]